MTFFSPIVGSKPRLPQSSNQARWRTKKYEPVIFTREAFGQLMSSVGTLQPEQGGPLLGSRKDWVVRKFIFDEWGSRTGASYDPDVGVLNPILKREWDENGLELIGWSHSHPRGIDCLSGGDVAYLERIFDAIPALDRFITPIVQSSWTGPQGFHPYIVYANDPRNYRLGRLDFVESETVDEAEPRVPTEAAKKAAKPKRKRISKRFDRAAMDDKARGAISPELMRSAKVFAVGAGGAGNIYLNFARAGLGRLTILDKDYVDPTNLVTQGWAACDIGQPKTQALMRRMRAVAPDVAKRGRYSFKKADFLTATDEALENQAGDADLIMMMTDDFECQARGNRLALKLRKPALFGMMYEKARAFEAVFTIPGVTPGCFRCAVSSRYSAYQDGYENEVGSDGTLISQTDIINAVLCDLALAILHRNEQDCEYGTRFGATWDRNLLQFRLNPNYQSALFARAFGKVPHANYYDAVWQRIEPEQPPAYDRTCPDCGGSGDLTQSVISDTRPPRMTS